MKRSAFVNLDSSAKTIQSFINDMASAADEIENQLELEESPHTADKGKFDGDYLLEMSDKYAQYFYGLEKSIEIMLEIMSEIKPETANTNQ